MSTIQKVRNWQEYNRSLQKRGGLLFSFSEDYLDKLYFKGEQKRGGSRIYSKEMYEFLLTIKVVLRLPWRATIGFAEGLLRQIFKKTVILIPNFGHSSREASKIDLKIKQFLPKNISGIELAFDSTGVNVYTTSGYHQRRYGKEGLYRGKEQWKKIHIALDLNNLQVMGVDFTDSNVNDCESIKCLSDQIECKVESVRADGAYDTKEFYKIIHEWGAKALIPPAKTSKSQDELINKPKDKKTYLFQRDEILKFIRQHKDFNEGLKQWKIASGYHKRSLIEAFMFRFKKTFGFHLQHKTEQARINETIIKINMLNKMISLGMAKYVT